MPSTEIRRLIEQGVLQIAPVRARSAADAARIRAALAEARKPAAR